VSTGKKQMLPTNYREAIAKMREILVLCFFEFFSLLLLTVCFGLVNIRYERGYILRGQNLFTLLEFNV
jgi:hypothetical protein